MNEFSQNLAEARGKSGLSQEDCAHLLGVSQSQVSRLELGRQDPSVADLCGASILFGRTIEFMIEPLLLQRAMDIQARLQDLPDPRGRWLGRFVRSNTLHKIDARVERIITHYER